MLAMVVNDDDGNLIPPGAFKCIVGTPPGASSLLQVITCRYISRGPMRFDTGVTLRHSARPLIKPIP